MKDRLAGEIRGDCAYTIEEFGRRTGIPFERIRKRFKIRRLAGSEFIVGRDVIDALLGAPNEPNEAPSEHEPQRVAPMPTQVGIEAIVNADPRLTPQQAAAYLGNSPDTLSAWRCRGDGPHYFKLGAAVRYLKSDLDKFIADKRRSKNRIQEPRPGDKAWCRRKPAPGGSVPPLQRRLFPGRGSCMRGAEPRGGTPEGRGSQWT
jgi:hypothetical protein